MNRGARAGAWAVTGAALLFALFPVYWLALTAFRPRGEIFSRPVSLLPEPSPALGATSDCHLCARNL